VNGRSRFTHWADIVIILGALLEIAASLMGSQTAGSLGFLKFLRVLRFARWLKLKELSVVKDLDDIVQGLAATGRITFWIWLILIIIVYGVGIVMIYIFGNCVEGKWIMCSDDNVLSYGHNPRNSYFGSVLMAMGTVGRCLFGECTTEEGFPLSVVLTDLQPTGSRVFSRVSYSMFLTMSQLWLPSALGAVLTARLTSSLATKSRMRRRDLNEEKRTLVQGFGDIADEVRQLYDQHMHLPNGTSAHAESLIFTRKLFVKIMQSQGNLQKLLIAMAIPDTDPDTLFNLIDVSDVGRVNLLQIIVFLTDWRGDVEKADVYKCLTALRHLEVQMRCLQERKC